MHTSQIAIVQTGWNNISGEQITLLTLDMHLTI